VSQWRVGDVSITRIIEVENAFLFVRSEYERWLADQTVQGGHFADSVRPVVDAGLV
jgi:hypothetical protein